MARTYSPEQTTYLATKAEYETALRQHEAFLTAHDFYALLDTADDTALVALECKAQECSSLDVCMDALLKSEKALFAWGEAHAAQARRARSHQGEAALLKNMFANIHRYPHLKEKLAGICLQLDLNA